MALTETREPRMDPDLREYVNGLLKPYKGEQLELAEMAVMETLASPVVGSWDDITAAYKEAVKAAVV